MNKKMQVGLGEATRRLNVLDYKVRSNVASSAEKEEHSLLMNALDNIKIDLGFDCDGDGIPDSIEIFTATATTSCCRLIDLEDLPKPQRKRKTSSRRK